MHVLYALCFTPRPGTNGYRSAYAMAHPQIDSEDPLAFFVDRNAQVIINPLIITHTEAPIFKREGCMSFQNEKPALVGRYNKITVAYQTITPEGTLSKDLEWDLKGVEAQFWQHEIDHLNAKYIYDLSKANPIPDDTNSSPDIP